MQVNTEEGSARKKVMREGRRTSRKVMKEGNEGRSDMNEI